MSEIRVAVPFREGVGSEHLVGQRKHTPGIGHRHQSLQDAAIQQRRVVTGLSVTGGHERCLPRLVSIDRRPIISVGRNLHSHDYVLGEPVHVVP